MGEDVPSPRSSLHHSPSSSRSKRRRLLLSTPGPRYRNSTTESPPSVRSRSPPSPSLKGSGYRSRSQHHYRNEICSPAPPSIPFNHRSDRQSEEKATESERRSGIGFIERDLGQHRNRPLGLEKPRLPPLNIQDVDEYGFQYFRSGKPVSDELCREFEQRLPFWSMDPFPAERLGLLLEVLRINLRKTKRNSNTKFHREMVAEYTRITKASSFDEKSSQALPYRFLAFMGSESIPTRRNGKSIGGYKQKTVYVLNKMRYQYYGFLAKNSGSLNQVLDMGNPYTEMVFIGGNGEVPHRLMFDFDYILPRLIVKRGWEWRMIREYDDEEEGKKELAQLEGDDRSSIHSTASRGREHRKGEELTTGFAAFLVRLLERFLTMMFDLDGVDYEIRAATTKPRVNPQPKKRGYKVGLRITTSFFMTFKDRQLLYKHFVEVANVWYADGRLNPLLRSGHYRPEEMPPITNIAVSAGYDFLGPNAESPLDPLRSQRKHFLMRNLFTVKLKEVGTSEGDLKSDPSLRRRMEEANVRAVARRRLSLVKGGVPVPVLSGRSRCGRPFRFNDAKSIKFDFLCSNGAFHDHPLPGSDAYEESSAKEREKLCRNVVYENYVAFAPMTLPLYELRKSVTVEGFDPNLMNLADGYELKWDQDAVETRVRAHFEGEGGDGEGVEVDAMLEAMRSNERMSEDGGTKTKNDNEVTCLGAIRNPEQREQVKELVIQGCIPLEVFGDYYTFSTSCKRVAERVRVRMVDRLNTLFEEPREGMSDEPESEKETCKQTDLLQMVPALDGESDIERMERLRKLGREWRKTRRIGKHLAYLILLRTAGRHLAVSLLRGRLKVQTRIDEGVWNAFSSLGILDPTVAENEEQRRYIDDDGGRKQLLSHLLTKYDGELSSFARALEWDASLRTSFNDSLWRFLREEVKIYKIVNKKSKKEEMRLRFLSRYCPCKGDRHQRPKTMFTIMAKRGGSRRMWRAVVMTASCPSENCKEAWVTLLPKRSVMCLLSLLDPVPEATMTLLGHADWYWNSKEVKAPDIQPPQPTKTSHQIDRYSNRLQNSLFLEGHHSSLVRKEDLFTHVEKLVEAAFDSTRE